MNAIDTLIAAIQEKQSPIVMGLDPTLENIPTFLKEASISKYGDTIKASVDSIWNFNQRLIEVLHPYIPCIKLQMACYELFGSEGMEVLEKTVKLAKQYKLSVIADGKRNDIGSSAALYAKAYLGERPLITGKPIKSDVDFLTVNPLLGSDSLTPFIEEAKKNGKGIFVLVRTSNPSATEYQEAKLGDSFLYEKIAQDLQQYAKDLQGESGYSLVGAVVGATWKEEQKKLRETMPNVFFLVPGYGAQGAKAKDILPSFDAQGGGAIINASRSIMYAYQNKIYNPTLESSRFAQAALAAVKDMLSDIETLRQ